MQVRVLKRNGLRLSQGVAVLLLAGISAGCSSARFGGTDDFMTASTTPNQREIIRPSGDTGAQPAGNYDSQSYIGSQAAPASGGVTRGELAPVSNASSAPAPQPTQTASIPLAETAGGTMAQQHASVNGNEAGTRVTVQAGDTVYGLARRYGVPADTIMRANNMSPSDNLRSGSKILIPGASSEIVTQTASVATTKAAETAKTVAAGTYKVQEGDTLSRIASRTGASVTAIKQANGLSDGAIRIGQTLKIPGSGGSTQVASAAPATPVKTDAAPAATKTAAAPAPAPKQPEKSEQVAAYTPPKKTEKVIDEASETAPDATGIGRMRWPVRGRVISQFGKGGGKTSDGIDISVPEGTSVKAAENGVVIYAGDGLKEFGNTVLVRHEDGLVTVYGHASNLKVQRGDKVKRGQEIAVSGMSGQTDAPKLHFEVRKNSAPVDPAAYLE